MKIRLNTIEKVKKFISVATLFDGDLVIESGKYVVDGKSIMGILSLDLNKDLILKVFENVDGETEKLINKLKELELVA
jgi:phosphotransferase system HPr-like phosphotransfer protein